MRVLKKRCMILNKIMDVEKAVRKELRGREVSIRPSETLATTVVKHIHKKVLDKRRIDKERSGDELVYEPQEEVVCYCLEEVGAKLLSVFLEGSPDDIMHEQVVGSSIPYDELRRYAEKKGLLVTPLALNEQEKNILSLVHEHGDEQTLLGLRKSFEYLQKEYEKNTQEQLKE